MTRPAARTRSFASAAIRAATLPTRRAVLVGAAALAVAGRAAAATDWAIDRAVSTIDFDYTLNGAAASGSFRRFGGAAVFDSASSAATRLDLAIEVAGLDLGDPLYNAVALGAEWFDAAAHPVARYRLARLAPVAEGGFEALGDLTIRDTLRIVRTPVALTLTETSARATGSVTVNRADFGVGAGLTTLFVDIGPVVSVRFDLTARPVP